MDVPLTKEEREDVLAYWDKKRLEDTIVELQDQIKQQAEEMKVLDWYHEHLENGLSLDKVYKQLNQLQREHGNMMNKNEQTVKDLEL